MKILLLNPHINAEHQVATGLKNRGLAILVTATGDEAWQMLQLHGQSVDLAFIHREGPGGEPGIQFLKKLKADSAQKDLPVVVTTEAWGDAECARHQSTPQGANAYLHWPAVEKQFSDMIEAVLGQQIGAESSVAIPAPARAPTAQSSVSIPTAATESSVVLQDPSTLDAGPKVDTSGITLEAPEPSMAIELSEPEPPAVPESPAIPEVEIAAVTHSGLSLSTGALKLGAGTKTTQKAAPAAPQKHASKTPLKPAAKAPAGRVPLRPRPPADEAQEVADDAEIASELPYLFGGKKSGGKTEKKPSLALVQPLGDAVVPGGAAHSPDLETFKKYLMLREQDVAALSTDLRAAKDQIAALESQLKEERGRTAELSLIAADQKKRIETFEKEKDVAVSGARGDLDDVKFEMKAKNDKLKLLETQVREAAEEMERLKERVRTDIRKIRVREKELENRLEIAKRDAEALIGARESKIIELKRKLDTLEFNMDLLQDQYAREKENAAKLREKLERAAQAVRAAGGLLDKAS